MPMLTGLPLELLEVIGAHLDAVDLARLGCVCRTFRELFAHTTLWRRLYRALRWSEPHASPSASSQSHIDSISECRRHCLYEWARNEWRYVANRRWRHRRLEGHQGSVQAVQLLRRFVISGALDGRVKVWERETGACKYTFAKHKGPVAALRYDGSSHLMASGGYDGTIQLYNLKGGIANALLHSGKVFAMELYEDQLLAAGASGVIRTYRVTTQKLVSTLPGHDGSVMSLSADGPSRLLASGGSDKEVKLWDLRVPLHSPTAKLLGHTSTVSSVSLHDYTAVTSSLSSSGELFVWDLRKLAMNGATVLLVNLSNSTAGATRSSYYDGCKLLSSAERESSVRVWDPRDWTCRAKWPHASPSWSFDGRSVSAFVAGGRDYSVNLWEKGGLRKHEARDPYPRARSPGPEHPRRKRKRTDTRMDSH